jgi:hypothetical protein
VFPEQAAREGAARDEMYTWELLGLNSVLAATNCRLREEVACPKRAPEMAPPEEAG